MQGRVTGLPENVKPEKPDGDGHEGKQGAGRRDRSKEDAITEVSDEDYRSFCYPCYAMDEASDHKQGK